MRLTFYPNEKIELPINHVSRNRGGFFKSLIANIFWFFLEKDIKFIISQQVGRAVVTERHYEEALKIQREITERVVKDYEHLLKLVAEQKHTEVPKIIMEKEKP